MQIAIPHWRGRVSPVFDVSRRLLVVEVESRQIKSRRETILVCNDPMIRAKHITRLDVEVLICGAVSLMLETLLRTNGIQVIAWTCGPVDDVLTAFINEKLNETAFLMPGCGRRQNRGNPYDSMPFKDA